MTIKRIAVLYTGGTIGMAPGPHGYAPVKDFAAALSALLNAAGHRTPQYTLFEYPTPIDSSNATPQDWQRIAQDIANRYHDFDGFVVLHGTDTMAYTASALSFMLQGLKKPVIVTGSQIPLGQARSDALQNLITAMEFAALDDITEVAISFNQRLLRGNRATKVSAERMQAFDSPNYPWLAEAGIRLRLNRAAMLPPGAKENFQLPAYSHGRILPLRFVPGLPVLAVQAMLALDPQALILQCYGSGNAPDRDPALTDALACASARGIVLVACSQSPHGEVEMGSYATGSALARAGVVGAKDMSFEAIFAKLHHLFALGLSPDEVRAAMLQNFCGELGA